MTDRTPDAAPPDHPDAKKAKIADAEKRGGDHTSIGHDGSNPATLESYGAAAFRSTAELLGAD